MPCPRFSTAAQRHTLQIEIRPKAAGTCPSRGWKGGSRFFAGRISVLEKRYAPSTMISRLLPTVCLGKRAGPPWGVSFLGGVCWLRFETASPCSPFVHMNKIGTARSMPPSDPHRPDYPLRHNHPTHDRTHRRLPSRRRPGLLLTVGCRGDRSSRECAGPSSRSLREAQGSGAGGTTQDDNPGSGE
jgi:hypothetical protein